MNDQYWMERAIMLAERAARENEVPVGAVVVLENQIIGEGWNQPIATHDPSAHAEIQAMRQAAKQVANYRLLNATLYVTLEPCVMCLGAMIHARIGRLVFGADDPKAGAVKSVAKLLDHVPFNHKIVWECGISTDTCSKLLTQFFEKKRQNQKQEAMQST